MITDNTDTRCYGLVIQDVHCPIYVKCERKGITVYNSKFWCQQHNPVMLRERQKQHDARNEILWDAMMRKIESLRKEDT